MTPSLPGPDTLKALAVMAADTGADDVSPVLGEAVIALQRVAVAAVIYLESATTSNARQLATALEPLGYSAPKGLVP